MAQLVVNIPDQHVAELVAAIAPRLDTVDNATVAGIATRIVAGETTTAAEKKAMAEFFCQRQLWQAWRAYKQTRASAQAATEAIPW